MDEQKVALIKLNLVKNIGPGTIRKLVDYIGDISSVLTLRAKDLKGIECLNKSQREELGKEEYDILLEQEIKLIEKDADLDVLTYLDAGYPENLKMIYQSPPVLYVKGQKDLLGFGNIFLAVVGTRTPTVYGQIAVEHIVPSLCAAGIVIVSGLAIGIDTIAHKAALRVGKTIAVLGSGIYNIYPSINEGLAEEIAAEGVVFSEFPLRSGAVPQNFPQRNRILSGLSNGVLVIQAAKKSGSLITAGYALEQGRDVFAVPGNITAPMSVGTNHLIQDGAYPVLSGEDLLLYYGLKKEIRRAGEQIEITDKSKLTSDEIRILNKLKAAALTADQLYLRLNDIKVSELQKMLVYLELNGYIKRYAGAKYIGSF